MLCSKMPFSIFMTPFLLPGYPVKSYLSFNNHLSFFPVHCIPNDTIYFK